MQKLKVRIKEENIITFLKYIMKEIRVLYYGYGYHLMSYASDRNDVVDISEYVQESAYNIALQSHL